VKKSLRSLSPLLVSSAFFFTHEEGPVAFTEPIVLDLVHVRNGSNFCRGMSATGTVSLSIDLSKRQITNLEKATKDEKFVVMLHRSSTQNARESV
jgi:hypothetical protein